MKMNPSDSKFRNRLLLAIGLLIFSVLLVACGGGSAETTPTETAATTAPQSTEVVEAPTEAAEEPTAEPAEVATAEGEATAEPAATETAPETATERAGVLRVAMQPVVNIDPLAISSDSEVLLANHVYDYLVDIDPQNKPISRLATAWDVSEDGLTYVLTLAEGVSWHDGDPFSAEDVVWTFERLRDTPDTPTANLYSNVANIEATGDLEVTFTLTEPNPFFLYDLSDNHALVLKAGTTDADTVFNGTGPFIVTNYSPEDRVEMTANENYFVAGQPRLTGLEIIFFNDEAASIDALRGGQIDLALRMATPLFQSLQDEPGIVTIDIPTNGFDLIRLRSDRAPGDDPRVIQALKLATDREAIFQVVQQGFGAIGNDTPIGPSYEAYHDPDAVPPTRDVETARALLAEAGYDESNPLQMVLHTPDTGGRPDLAAVLQQQWGEAGVQIEISVEPESVYYADPVDGEGGWLGADLGITGWGSRPYPQFYLDTMLVTDAVWNESHFSDEEFDQLAATAGTTLDEEERVQAYADIQQLLVDRGPIIVPYFFAQFAAISDQFENFELKGFAGRTDFRNVTFMGS
jgi:peptide/nickel transport system substrate-binding protein